MSLSEKIKNAKFSKGVAGYSVKEVDGFICDILPLVTECEQQLSALRVKLEAVEYQSDAIKKRENEAERMLEKAKSEAERIINEAKAIAKETVSQSETEALEKGDAAKRMADELLNTAKKNASAIIVSADKKGRETLAAANGNAEEINAKAEALSKEIRAFEENFRAAVADTVKKLSDIRASSPKAVPVMKAEPKTEKKADVIEILETKDYEFAGGKQLSAKKAESSKRRLYDTVTVTYDAEDDFEDVKKIKNEGAKKEIKNPTDF